MARHAQQIDDRDVAAEEITGDPYLISDDQSSNACDLPGSEYSSKSESAMDPIGIEGNAEVFAPLFNLDNGLCAKRNAIEFVRSSRTC